MTALKKTIIRNGLETLYFSGAYQVLRATTTSSVT